MFTRRTGWDLCKNPFTLALERHRESGRRLLDLTASNPTSIGLAYDEPRILAALATRDALVYRPEPRGLLPAREAVARYYRDLHDHSPESPIHPDAVLLTTSTSEAYSFALRLLCDPGDEVLIPTPSYPLLEFLAQINDVKLVAYELVYDHGWQIDFHSLGRAMTPRARAIIVVNPNNPTGSYVRNAEAEQLNQICRDRDLALIVDEVFYDFALAPNQRSSCAFNQDALTLTLSGLSKISGLPQMKFAWIVISGPPELTHPALQRLEIISDTYLSMNAPIQLAAADFLALRHSFQAQLMARLRANLAHLDSHLVAATACSRLLIEGGWYAVLRVPVTRSDEEFAIALLQSADVLVHPGHFYDFPGDGYLVLSLITPEAEFREAVSRAMRFLSS